MSSSAMHHFSPFAGATWRVLSFLALGLDGKATVTITTSKKGLTLKIAGETVARGKDPRALSDDLDRHMERRQAVLADMKAHLARIEAKAAKAG